jgi:hypothetical protein
MISSLAFSFTLLQKKKESSALGGRLTEKVLKIGRNCLVSF